MEVSFLRHKCFSDNKKPEVFDVFYKYLCGLQPQRNWRNFIYFGYIDIKNNKVANQLFNCVLKNIKLSERPREG